MNLKRIIFLSGVLCIVAFMGLYAQEPTESAGEDPTVIYIVTKNDGTHYVGPILKQDAREVLIDSREVGLVYIPRHEIRSIREAESREISTGGVFVPAEVFSTRYFITTNGLPVKKGETYALWSLLGPDFQFGVSDNVGIGVLTSWIGTPMIGSVKYSVDLGNNWSTGAGLLLGTGSWAYPDVALALPYAVITSGDRVRNINISFGYGAITYKRTITTWDFSGYHRERRVRENESNFLLSVAGMAKVGKSVSLVFDSFIVPRGGTYNDTEWYEYFDQSRQMWVSGTRTVKRKRYGFALLIPGIRLQTNPTSAFQFGFGALRAEGETQPIPFPVVQWFRML